METYRLNVKNLVNSLVSSIVDGDEDKHREVLLRIRRIPPNDVLTEIIVQVDMFGDCSQHLSTTSRKLPQDSVKIIAAVWNYDMSYLLHRAGGSVVELCGMLLVILVAFRETCSESCYNYSAS